MAKGFPIQKTIKLGIKSVKAKPIRFTITIILFFICLSIVGWGFNAYFNNTDLAAYNAILNSNTTEIIISQTLREDAIDHEGNIDTKMSKSEADVIRAGNPDFTFYNLYNWSLPIPGFTASRVPATYNKLDFTNCVAVDNLFLEEFGFRLLAGKLPETEFEFAIPDYIYELYRHYGYADEMGKKKEILSYTDILGVSVSLTDKTTQTMQKISLVGVVDTGYTAQKWRFEILNKEYSLLSKEEYKEYEKAEGTFYSYINNGCQSAFLVHESFFPKYIIPKSSRSKVVQAVLTSFSGNKTKDIGLVKFARSNIDSMLRYGLNGMLRHDVAVLYTAGGNVKPMGLIVLIAMPLFTALMMFNFISATIMAKQKDIGILRALGAKNRTVIGIFLSESIFTALIAYVLSIFGSIAICKIFNLLLPFNVAVQSLFIYGILEALFVLGLGLAIATIGSIIPILRTIKKKPMEIMR